EVALSGPKAGRVIYVVSIPQSNRAPHMASDNRYYKRFNFESVPLDDYEVRDISRRLMVPDLYLSFRFDTDGVLGNVEPGTGRYQGIGGEVFAANRSPAPADFALLRWCVDSRLGERPIDNEIAVNGSMISVGSMQIDWRGNLRLPIWDTLEY